jgi:hypothetical protein
MYKIKAIPHRPGPFIKYLEFTTCDKLDIGDEIKYIQEDSNLEENGVPVFPARFVCKFTITDITKV